MEIFNKFKIIESYPALYLKKEKILIISDIHLGLESLMASEGIYFPKFQLDEIKKDLSEILSKVNAKQIIINGDLKHEFSETTWKEREEVQNLIDFLNDKVKEISLVKGNHDNYLIYAVKEKGVKLKDKIVVEDVCFLHGHKKIDLSRLECSYLILGHEHPALALKDKLGVKEKIRCFLYGDIKNKKIIVMPALSKFARGSQVNQIPKYELMSPILKEHGVGDLKAIGVSKEAGLLKFPEVKKIK